MMRNEEKTRCLFYQRDENYGLFFEDERREKERERERVRERERETAPQNQVRQLLICA
jgi:hypothetical protein